MGLTPLQYERQTAYAKFQRRFNKYKYVSFSYTYLGYNLEDRRFADRRVRQALTHAINKKEIVGRGPSRPGTGGHRTLQARDLVLQPRRAPLSL